MSQINRVRVLIPNEFFVPAGPAPFIPKSTTKKEKPKSKKALREEMEQAEADALQALIDKKPLKRKDVVEYFKSRA